MLPMHILTARRTDGVGVEERMFKAAKNAPGRSTAQPNSGQSINTGLAAGEVDPHEFVALLPPTLALPRTTSLLPAHGKDAHVGWGEQVISGEGRRLGLESALGHERRLRVPLACFGCAIRNRTSLAAQT
jgi:hypothetical protein